MNVTILAVFEQTVKFVLATASVFAVFANAMKVGLDQTVHATTQPSTVDHQKRKVTNFAAAMESVNVISVCVEQQKTTNHTLDSIVNYVQHVKVNVKS